MNEPLTKQTPYEVKREVLRSALIVFLNSCGTIKDFEREVRKLVDEVQPWALDHDGKKERK